MQQESKKKFTDGERLDKLKREQRYTWVEIARDIGVTTSMIHMVRRGEKRLGREPSARLSLIEASGRTATDSTAESEGKPCLPPSAADKATMVYPSGFNEILGHIVWLEDQLNSARSKEDRLLKIIEAMAGLGENRVQADIGPPAGHAPASGVNYSTRKKDNSA